MFWTRLLEHTTRRPILVVTALGLVTAIVVAFQILSIMDSTRRATALEAAQSYSRAISSIRAYYSSVVVPRAREAGAAVTHNYHDVSGAIPLPATLTIELGEQVALNNQDGEFRLLSGLPFPWRETGGARDRFEADALTALDTGTGSEFVRVEQRNGRSELRYAQAVRMKESCVACHNSHPLSPRTDWKVGDVRGIQTVSVPLPGFLSGPVEGGRSTEVLQHFTAVIAVLIGALALIGSLLFGLKLMVTRQDRLLKLIRHRNRKLARAKVEAESASRMKTEFLATMSHELRTPLNAVIGFSEALKSEMFGDIGNPQYKDFAGHIHESGGRLLEIINNIIDLSRIEAGEYEIYDSPIDIAEAVHKVVDLEATEIETGRIDVAVDVPADLPYLLAGERAVRQTLHNLVQNAVKFTSRGGTVGIGASVTRNGEIEITIEDTGMGMDPDQVTLAMTPFAQIDGGLDRQFEGTGLGLPLSRRLVEIHDGTLLIDSEVGKGTRIQITFPKNRTQPRDMATAA